MKYTFPLFTLCLTYLLLASSCTKNDDYFYPSPVRTLVIVSDNEPSSDVIVGLMGAVRSKFPEVQIEFFQAPAFDIYEGAYLLQITGQSFPKGTIVAGLIEPGAFGKGIVYQAGSRTYIAPDNKLSSRVLFEEPKAVCYFVENPKVLGGLQPEEIAFGEFYTQAILSLLSGTSLQTFGSVCKIPQVFKIQPPVIEADTIKGEVLFTDNFGNCVTNIPEKLLNGIPVGTILNFKSGTTGLSIVLGTSYSSVPVGDRVCFINSTKRLEIAINYGDFAGTYQIGANAKVFLIKP